MISLGASTPKLDIEYEEEFRLSSLRESNRRLIGDRHSDHCFPHAYYRQSTASDLGAMAKRAGAEYLVLTHLIPALGAERQGPFKIPGGPLTEADYVKAVQDGGFTGHVLVGTDLASIRLPASGH